MRELNQSFRDLVKKVIETEEIDRIVFFIDDLEPNINAAKEAGMGGLVFTGDINEVKKAIGF